jgi:hypothetical protein
LKNSDNSKYELKCKGETVTGTGMKERDDGVIVSSKTG